MAFKKTQILIATLFIFLFMVVGVSLVSAIGTYPAVDPNMVLYYHFNNGTGENDTLVYDFSGNDNNGTASNIIFLPGTGILGDGSMYFNGVNSTFKAYRTANNSMFNFSLTGMTLSVWINTSSSTAVDIISQYTAEAGNNRHWNLGTSLGVGRFNAYADGATNTGISGSSGVNDGRWHNIVASYNGTKIFIYIDGILENSASITDLWWNVTSAVEIGKLTINAKYNGSIDEVIIWNRSLSSSEINNNYYNYINCGSIPFDGCVINQPTTFNLGEYYFSNSIYFTSDNSYLDGNGSTIFSNSSSFILDHLNNVTIRNLILSISADNYTNLYDGIYIYNSTNVSVKDNNITLGCGNYHSGIHVRYSENISSINNTIKATGDTCYGILYTLDTINSNILNNTIYNYGTNGYTVHLEFRSNNNIIDSNYLYSNSSAGTMNVYLENASNSIISNNHIVADYCEGIKLESGSSHNNITNNFINTSNIFGTSGIRLQQDTPSYGNNEYNYIFNNTIYAKSYGIAFIRQASSNNLAEGNKIYVSLYGFHAREGAYNNTYINNSVYVTDPLGLGYYLSNSTNSSFYGLLGYSFRSYFESKELNTSNYLHDLTSALLFFSNNSASICNGDCNITLIPSAYAYVYDQNNISIAKSWTNLLAYDLITKQVLISTNINSNDGYYNNSNLFNYSNNQSGLLDNYNITEGYSRDNDPIFNGTYLNNTLIDTITVDTYGINKLSNGIFRGGSYNGSSLKINTGSYAYAS